jgi:hypothetical protein
VKLRAHEVGSPGNVVFLPFEERDDLLLHPQESLGQWSG